MNKFIPKNYKYKKIHKNVRIVKRVENRSLILKNYKYGLKILTNGVISAVTLEAARRSITRKLNRAGRIRIKGFPYIPTTSKPVGTRMGKGYGTISEWIFPVKKGRILFEVDDVPYNVAKNALLSAAHKLPVKSKFILKK